MIRIVLSTIVCLLISFGAISKNQQASELLNHVSQEHHVHQHSDGHKYVSHHDHHTDHSEETDHTEEESNQPNHSHNLEMSLLAFTMTAITTNDYSIISPLVLVEQKIANVQTSLNVSHFSSTVFRPP